MLSASRVAATHANAPGESDYAIAGLRKKEPQLAVSMQLGFRGRVRGPLGPPDIIGANRVANGLTGAGRSRYPSIF